jgi:hypothetical protein
MGLRSSHHPSSDQLISSQLNQIGVPLSQRRGAGALSGDVLDFELGQGGRVSNAPQLPFDHPQGVWILAEDFAKDFGDISNVG